MNAKALNQTNARALQPNTEIGNQYIIKKVIGEGGFGITYLAEDIYLKINVAIKEYFPAQFSTRDTTGGTTEISVISGEMESFYEKGLRDYEKEGHRLTQFNHLDGIVSVLNFFFENNTAYLVMEYVEGITLKQYLMEAGGKFPWKRTLEMFRPVIGSFSQIHKAGIIHRDISPDNIMISKDGKLTIIDFGAARNDDNEKSKTITLKHGYAPPEQYSRNGDQGTWTDVYALCSTMYRMITGVRLPDSFSFTSGESKYIPMKNYAQGIPVYVENAIARGLEPDVRDRIPTMDVLESVLYKNGRIGVSRSRRKNIIKYSAIGLAAVSLLAVLIILIPRIISGTNHEEAGGESVINQSGTVSAEVEEEPESEDDGEQEETNEVKEEDIIPDLYLELNELPIENINYESSEEGMIITSFDNSVTETKLPSEIEGVPVVGINGVGSNITILYLPEGIKYIGEKAFRNSVYLEKIYIPSTVESIGEGAFDNCQSLNEITVSKKNKNYYVSENSLFTKEGNAVTGW